ncbi:hypothetical protein H6F38_15035 [Paenibacillus sp. EKM208P]|nr:hypothetical protein H6F38_15035 [Paenibacillus sp. EKM208P]
MLEVLYYIATKDFNLSPIYQPAQAIRNTGVPKRELLGQGMYRELLQQF